LRRLRLLSGIQRRRISNYGSKTHSGRDSEEVTGN